MRYVSIYYQRGPAPKGSSLRFEIRDPPTSGWSRALVIPGEKSSTVFCPFTFESHRISNHASELTGSKPIKEWDEQAFREQIGGIVTNRWAYWTKMGFQKAYDVAAVVLTNLGLPVPKTVLPELKEGEERVSRGGKEINHEALRQVRKGSKRGRVAEFFLSDEPQSIREAMARLDLTRSGVLSHLFGLNRYHGIGYVLVNDCARLLVPDDFDLFAVAEPLAASPKRSKAGQSETNERVDKPQQSSRKPQGKPTDPSRFVVIPEPSRRADVAQFFLEWASLEEAMAKFQLTRSAVLSMLYQIWKDNGFGYEVDGSRGRLLVPQGAVVFGEKQPRKKKKG